MTDTRTATSRIAAESNPETRTRWAQERRSLNEPVLSSAEDELDMDTHDTGASYTGTSGSSMNYQGGSKPDWWVRMEDQVSQFVSVKPGRAALVALGAGALLALLVGRRMGGKRRKD